MRYLGPEFAVPYYESDIEDSSDVATLSDGKFVVVHTHDNGVGVPGGPEIWGELFNADGTRTQTQVIFQELGYSPGTDALVAKPSVAAGGGWFTTVFVDHGSSFWTIRGSTMDNAADPGSGHRNVLLADGAAQDLYSDNPDVAMLQEPLYGLSPVMVYDQISISGQFHRIVVTGLTNVDLTATAVGGVIEADFSFQPGNPAIAANVDNWLVAYSLDGNITGAYHKPGTDPGNFSRLPIADHAENLFEPDVAYISGDRFLAVYSNHQDIYGQIFYVTSVGNGLAADPEFLISQSHHSAQDPHVAALANGGFVVTWTDVIGSDQDASGTGIVARQFNSLALPTSNELVVNNSTNGDQNQSSVATSGGNILVSWTDKGSVTAPDVHARMLSTGNEIRGGEGNDNLAGTDSDDLISGFGGSDALAGNDGNDTINGGDGNDLIDGGAGADTMSGGAGDDIFEVDNPGDVVIENADEGIDRVDSYVSWILSANVENLVLYGSSNIDGTGNDLANAIAGNLGDNVLHGLGGDDQLYGFAGNDILVGGDGIDTAFFSGPRSAYTLTPSGNGGLIVSGPDGTDTLFTIERLAFDDQTVDLVPPVCFCRGTMVLTDRGEVAVENLRVGERVRTLFGELKPIVWIGVGRDLVTRANKLARPVIVRQGALAVGVPTQDLYLTHGHALYLDGVLIPVENLVNHRSILWDESARVVEFFHIELEDHDVLLANGAPAESYYDASNRAQFHNTLPGSAPGEAKSTFAPVLNGGEIVERAWTTVFERSGGPIACDTTTDPDLHLLVDGRRLDRTAIEENTYTFALAKTPEAALHLCSRSGVPSLLGITAHDHRRLGLALRRIVIEEPGIATMIEPDALVLLAGGCHPAEDGYAWTDGELALPPNLFAHLSGPFTVAIEIERPGMRYPVPPAAVAAA